MNINVDVFDVMAVVPHVYATIWATLIVIGLAVFTYFYYKKWNPKKKPGAIQSVVETSFEGFERSMEETAGPRLKPAYPYFFTLLIFIFISSTMELLGFVNPAGSIAFTLTLGLITFIGMFVIGIATQGFLHFVKHKYANPMEIIGQFSPLISISIRLFGAVFAGSILGALVTIIVTALGASAPVLAALPFINLIWIWTISGVTIFFGGLQAVVFVTLTMIYWNQELGTKLTKEEKSEQKAQKKLEKAKAKEEKKLALEIKQKQLSDSTDELLTNIETKKGNKNPFKNSLKGMKEVSK